MLVRVRHRQSEWATKPTMEILPEATPNGNSIILLHAHRDSGNDRSPGIQRQKTAAPPFIRLVAETLHFAMKRARLWKRHVERIGLSF